MACLIEIKKIKIVLPTFLLFKLLKTPDILGEIYKLILLSNQYT